MVNFQIFKNSFNLNYLTKLHFEFLNFSNNSNIIEQAVNLEKFLLKKISWPLFKENIKENYKIKGEKLDYENLCNLDQSFKPKEILGSFNFRRQDLTQKANLHINYCLKCHERGKDSCRKGLKKENVFIKNPLGNNLHGCPLDMHISEAILLKEQNYNLAALAVMMINNPLLALTGHRICNDCSKACIFQKQTQVDVPAIESKIFEDILAIPYGIEIYILLTQWNPLNINAPLPLKFNNKQALIVGAGPAGISLSYYLLRKGWGVNLIEANQIQPLKNKHRLAKFLSNDLENRLIDGFGGVASYGITARWNKNYLHIMRLILERNKNYSYRDGIRFGSNYTALEALEDGFNHIALATGAALQKIPNIKNLLGENISFSADFLMNLQMGGAYKKNNLTNLQIHLPAIVIGGGLTAIDTATELIHYYFRQIEKISNYYSLIKIQNKKLSLSFKEQKLLEKSLAAHNFLKNATLEEKYEFIEKLGGVTIIYHNKINQSAAYKINHEEVKMALATGVKFCPEFKISEIKKNLDGSYLVASKNGMQIEAKTILIAVGMEFNPLILKETEIIKELDLEKLMNQNSTSLKDDKKTNFIWHDKISLVGDANRFYQGSVVKAILNAKMAAKEISKIKNSCLTNFFKFRLKIAKLISIKKIANYCLIIIRSPSAKNFQSGQFFKIQNPESEPVALTPIYINHQESEIHFLMEIKGSSTEILSQMRKKEKVICMGPIGGPFEIFSKKKILIYIDQFLGLYNILPLIQSLKKNQCEISLVNLGFNINFNFYNKILKKNIDHIITNHEINFKQFDYIFTNKDIEIKDKSKIIKFANAPMQCMMKGICARCISQDTNGSYYYSCARSLLDNETRINHNLTQNSLQEKLTKSLY